MNANTLQVLSKVFDEEDFDTLMESLVKVVKPIYVQPNSIIFDVRGEAAAKWTGILFIRHGEAALPERNYV